MAREISLDTETTGLYTFKGDKIIEIGCVEMINHISTGNNYHIYINPEREVPEEAVKVHGLTTEFLSDKPIFKDIAQDFLDFVGDSTLVIHNAKFDMGFINHSLQDVGMDILPMTRVIDTLEMARRMFPDGSGKSLDALCRRFEIDNSSRTLHGALLDAQLLAEVYLELLGGKEPSFIESVKNKTVNKEKIAENICVEAKPVRYFEIPKEEMQAHKNFISKIEDSIWSKVE